MLICTIVCIFAVACNSHSFDTNNYTTKMHYVEKGETLWELGTYCKADGDDVRDWISAVKSLNGMSTSGLTEGTYIRIYIAK